MIQLIHNRKNYWLPDRWSEVTTDQYLNIAFHWDGADRLGLFKIMTGIDLNTETSMKLDKYVGIAYKFTTTEVPKFDKLVRQKHTEFTVKKRTMKCPRVGDLTVAQRTHFFTTIAGLDAKESPGEIAKMFPACLGIVFAPLYYDRKFDIADARKLTDLILAEPVVKTFGVGGFFFGKLLNSRLSGARDSRRTMLVQTIRERIFSRLQISHN